MQSVGGTSATAELVQIADRQIARLLEVYMRDTMDSGGNATLIELNC
jgi:hypothetical protein